MSYEEAYFRMANEALLKIISPDELREVLSQDMCELEPDFLGFVDKYYALSKIIPREATIIDFGCYLAAQSYFFKDHKAYIGVDVVREMRRFQPPNATHYCGSIQDFLRESIPSIYDPENFRYFAICNYVPDRTASRMVRERFRNCFCFYPF